MKVKAFTLSISLTVLFLINSAHGQNEGDRYLLSEYANNNRDSIINLALLYTGFDKSNKFDAKKANITIESIEEVDTTSASIHSRINGRAAWKIRFNDINYITDSLNRYKNNICPSSFEIHIDYKSGKLLKIVSNNRVAGPAQSFEEKRYFEDRYNGISGVFTGFPDDKPTHTFYEMLRIYYSSTLLSNNQIIAFYVLYKEKGHDPIPVWYLICDNVPVEVIRYDPNDNEFMAKPVASLVIINDKTVDPICVSLIEKRLR